jgi:hypothetical protein
MPPPPLRDHVEGALTVQFKDASFSVQLRQLQRYGEAASQHNEVAITATPWPVDDADDAHKDGLVGSIIAHYADAERRDNTFPLVRAWGALFMMLLRPTRQQEIYEAALGRENPTYFTKYMYMVEHLLATKDATDMLIAFVKKPWVKMSHLRDVRISFLTQRAVVLLFEKSREELMMDAVEEGRHSLNKAEWDKVKAEAEKTLEEEKEHANEEAEEKNDEEEKKEQKSSPEKKSPTAESSSSSSSSLAEGRTRREPKPIQLLTYDIPANKPNMKRKKKSDDREEEDEAEDESEDEDSVEPQLNEDEEKHEHQRKRIKMRVTGEEKDDDVWEMTQEDFERKVEERVEAELEKRLTEVEKEKKDYVKERTLFDKERAQLDRDRQQVDDEKKKAAAVLEKRNELKQLEIKIAAAREELSSLERQRDRIGAAAVDVAA